MKTAIKTELILSLTGYCNGYGTDRYKSSAGFTKDEREAIKSGKLVVIMGCRQAGGNHGSTIRIATHDKYGYSRRLATTEEQAAFDAI